MSTNQEQELKPCPFCGKPAMVHVESDHHGEFYCLGCEDAECRAHNESRKEVSECVEA